MATLACRRRLAKALSVEHPVAIEGLSVFAPIPSCRVFNCPANFCNEHEAPRINVAPHFGQSFADSGSWVPHFVQIIGSSQEMVLREIADC